MVRTADTAIKTGGKNSKRATSSNSARSRSPSSSSADRGYSSYNSVCPRETPQWQKPITSFFQNMEKSSNEAREKSEKSTIEATDGKLNEVPDSAMEEEVCTSSNSNIVNGECSSTNAEADMPMEEFFVNVVAKIRRRDEDHDLAPKKKRKLDPTVYAGLENLEN